MSNVEFNALYERSVDALKAGDINEETRIQLLSILERIKLLTESNAMPTDDAVDLVKKVIVGAFLTPIPNPELKVKTG